MSVATCACNGTGKIVDSIPEGPWVDKGSYQTRVGGGYSSRLCECRKNLERRVGNARWWTSETTWGETIDVPTLPGELSVSITTEVPISDDNYPLIRDEENFYWPSLIQVNDRSMIADDARAIAALLIRAAEEAERIDGEALARTSNTASERSASREGTSCEG